MSEQISGNVGKWLPCAKQRFTEPVAIPRKKSTREKKAYFTKSAELEV